MNIRLIPRSEAGLVSAISYCRCTQLQHPMSPLEAGTLVVIGCGSIDRQTLALYGAIVC